MADDDWEDPNFLAALAEQDDGEPEEDEPGPPEDFDDYGPPHGARQPAMPAPTAQSAAVAGAGQKRGYQDDGASFGSDEPPPLPCPCGAGTCIVRTSNTAANPGAQITHRVVKRFLVEQTEMYQKFCCVSLLGYRPCPAIPG